MNKPKKVIVLENLDDAIQKTDQVNQNGASNFKLKKVSNKEIVLENIDDAIHHSEDEAAKQKAAVATFSQKKKKKGPEFH